MMLLAVGASFRTLPVEVRERLAIDGDKLPRALEELGVRYGCEAVIVSTCNRVELYLARADTPVMPDAELIAEFLEEFHSLPRNQLRRHLYQHLHADAVGHLFRVAASLDSLIVGEGQIAGQVKRAYELAQERGSTGPLLHAVFQRARLVAKRVRTETGIAQGKVSISSAAVEYVRQVFDYFGDKTILVIGAGKMGELTLRHLRRLEPQRILVTNRSPDKAAALAKECGGTPVAWEQLDDVLVQADIVLSTTGARELVVTRDRYAKVLTRRTRGTAVIIDIAVPRDFDPTIHDGDRVVLFNVDDLKRMGEDVLRDRRKHVAAAESIVAQEVGQFLREWARRRNGPIIAQLTQDLEAKRQVIVKQLFQRLNGRLNEDDCSYIEGAFRLLQNQFLHGPITALTEDTHQGAPGSGGHTLLEALRKLFRLQE
jgi:glutamyl-tRNA reductase